MTDPFLIATAGLYLGLFWGLVAACLVLGWSLYGIWCGIAIYRRRRGHADWLRTLEVIEGVCGSGFPQVRDTTQYLRRIATGEAESLDDWQVAMRRKYEKDYAT